MIYNTSTPPKNGFFYLPKPLQPNTIICFYDRNSETFFNSGKCQLMNNNQYKIEAKPTYQPLKEKKILIKL